MIAIDDVSLIKQSNLLLLPGSRLLKRCVDLGVSIAILPVVIPAMMLIGLLVKVTSPGPIFYRHQRIGAHGTPIYAMKFRTMRVNADKLLHDYLEKHPESRSEWMEKHKLVNDPRVTKVGKALRKSSLDELPQFFNVLLGEMSLVGPRPIVDEEISRYGEDFPLYCSVLPGVTGLWQVSGRNRTTYEQRVGYDAFYARNWSLWLDLHILLRTFKVVLLGEGAC